MNALPAADFVLDAAANPSVLAGVDGKTSSRELVDHNLTGTINILEYCKTHKAGFVLLSTSRVYSIAPLAGLEVAVEREAFVPAAGAPASAPRASGKISPRPRRSRSTVRPSWRPRRWRSSTVRRSASPVFVNRCGVLAGAGQFGRADQGIFAY